MVIAPGAASLAVPGGVQQTLRALSGSAFFAGWRSGHCCYGIARVDASGRICERAIVTALGWR
jgi:hypothetical protein